MSGLVDLVARSKGVMSGAVPWELRKESDQRLVRAARTLHRVGRLQKESWSIWLHYMGMRSK